MILKLLKECYDFYVGKQNYISKIDHYQITLFFGTFFYPGWKLFDQMYLHSGEDWYFRLPAFIFGIIVFIGLKYSELFKQNIEKLTFIMSLYVTGEYFYLIYWAYTIDAFTFQLYVVGSFVVLGCYVFQWKNMVNLFSYLAYSIIGISFVGITIYQYNLTDQEMKLLTHFAVLYSLLFLISGTMAYRWIILADKAEKVHEENEKNKALLFHSSKLSQISQMAGGIAHELNNPLQAITFGLEMIKMEFPELEDHYLTKDIDSQTFRMKSIIDSLLKLKSEKEYHFAEPCDIKGLIDQTLRLYQEKLKLNQIKLNLDLDSVIVNGDMAELSQMLNHIIGNAFDSLIASQNFNKSLTISSEIKDSKVIVKVQDSGDKISEEVKEKLFSPFFTTKQANKQAGLGLSVSKTIIEKHSGHIYYQEDPKAFVFELPVLHKKDEAA